MLNNSSNTYKPIVNLGINQNGNGWSLHFQGPAPETLKEAITFLEGYVKLLEGYVKQECCGNPLRGCTDCPPPKKLTFEEWYSKLPKLDIKDLERARKIKYSSIWQAAQENK